MRSVEDCCNVVGNGGASALFDQWNTHTHTHTHTRTHTHTHTHTTHTCTHTHTHTHAHTPASQVWRSWWCKGWVEGLARQTMYNYTPQRINTRWWVFHTSQLRSKEDKSMQLKEVGHTRTVIGHGRPYWRTNHS